MSVTLAEKPETASVREEWTHALQTLETDVTQWSLAEGWRVHPDTKVFTEESTGQYAASDLTIETPEGERLTVEVKGRGPSQASGRVQLSAWPTLFRVMLLHKPGEADWVIRTDSGIPLRQPWRRETFVTLAKDLLNADNE